MVLYWTSDPCLISIGAMRVLITGDRSWQCKALADRVVTRLVARYGADLVVVHGGAAGVDTSFHLACQKHGVSLRPFQANRQALGKLAGQTRNREMVEAGADLCIALHRAIQTSKRTKDCVRQALAAGIRVYLIEDERAVPRRIAAGANGSSLLPKPVRIEGAARPFDRVEGVPSPIVPDADLWFGLAVGEVIAKPSHSSHHDGAGSDFSHQNRDADVRTRGGSPTQLEHVAAPKENDSIVGDVVPG